MNIIAYIMLCAVFFVVVQMWILSKEQEKKIDSIIYELEEQRKTAAADRMLRRWGINQ